MPVTPRGKSIILLALAAGVLNATAIRIPPAEFRATYVLGPAGRVVIQNLYGDVEITAWDRDEVLVQATKHSTDPDRLNDARVVVDSSLGLVSIHTQYTGADTGRPASVDYRIKVPRGANLENIRIINGGLSLNGLSGPIKASSVNGSIHAERLGGQVELSTINGHLDADFQQLSKTHTISLRSVNGPIHLGLPVGAGANILAQNLSGGIESEFARSWRTSEGHRLEAAVHGGGAQIHLHNVNGGISIRATWPTRGLPPIS
jgi:DUF4097 and DUF4098 domain-containing protein YvlB